MAHSGEHRIRETCRSSGDTWARRGALGGTLSLPGRPVCPGVNPDAEGTLGLSRGTGRLAGACRHSQDGQAPDPPGGACRARRRRLAGWRREHELVGLTGFTHESFGLADLLQPASEHMRLGVGSVAMAALPCGPGRQTMACVRCGLYLVDDGDTRLALLLRGPGDNDPDGNATLEVACADQAAAQRGVDEGWQPAGG